MSAGLRTAGAFRAKLSFPGGQREHIHGREDNIRLYRNRIYKVIYAGKRRRFFKSGG
jgi:hypothetical protein